MHSKWLAHIHTLPLTFVFIFFIQIFEALIIIPLDKNLFAMPQVIFGPINICHSFLRIAPKTVFIFIAD